MWVSLQCKFMFRSEIEFEGILNFLSCSARGSRLIRNSNEIELSMKMLKSCSTYRIAPLRAQDFSIWFILWISYEYRVYICGETKCTDEMEIKNPRKTFHHTTTALTRFRCVRWRNFIIYASASSPSLSDSRPHSHMKFPPSSKDENQRKISIFQDDDVPRLRMWGKGESALNIYLRLWANMRSKEIFIFSLCRCDFVNFHSHLAVCSKSIHGSESGFYSFKYL